MGQISLIAQRLVIMLCMLQNTWKKGDLIAVEGNLHSSAYTDKNGERHFDMSVYVERHQNYTSRKNKEILENAEKNEKKINDAIDSLDGSFPDAFIPEYEDDYEENPFE